jgi:predicted ATPase
MPRSSSTDTTSTTDTPATTSLSNKLYSREEDIAKLVDAYEKRDQRHLVLLVGQPGNGKTTLGSIIQPRVENDGGTFLTGRFDPLEHPEPFSPFIKASTQFVARALEAGQEESLTRIKTALSRAMDLSEIQTLTSIIPILAQVFGTTSPQTSNNQNQSTHGGDNGRSNFLVAFCNFMRAISHPNHPIVLFLDDLQSSDPGSLDVLKILVADKKIQGLLCIVAFRPVGVKHPFSLLLRQLEAGGILFVPVLPSPLDATSIQEWLVAHDLGLEDDRLEPMAQVIQQGTKGNAMAVKLCLRIMETNKDIVQETGGTPLQAGGDVKSLFKLLFMMVPSNCQRVCWVASCMGMEVDPQRLAQILPDNIPLALQAAEDAGIMMFVPHAHLSQTSQISSALKDCIIVDERDLTKGRYVFSNSTFKDCVYNLISDDDKKVQHTAIGNIYREADSNNVIMGIGIDIYRVVAHLSLGVDLLSPKGKEAFSRLCLQAGEHTSEWSEFVAAAKYLDLGIKLLDPQQKWRAQYELSIALYNASADVANCTGRYEEMDARLAEVLANAKDPLDKMRAYSIQMHSLSARTLHADALALGLKVLPKLGEVIPVRKSKSVVDSEVKAVRKLIEGTSEKEIMNMSPITDKKKLGAMKILNLLMASAVIAQGELVPLIACRMVRTTLQSGLAGASAVGFTALGAVLCAQGDIEVGTWCSELALNIVDQLEDKSCKGRVMAIHWGILSRFSKTWKRCQEPLKVSYRLCMEGGDNEVRNTNVVVANQIDYCFPT